MRVFIISSLFGALAAVTAVQAQHIGDIRQGRQLALDVCASCHAVRAGQTQSPPRHSAELRRNRQHARDDRGSS